MRYLQAAVEKGNMVWVSWGFLQKNKGSFPMKRILIIVSDTHLCIADKLGLKGDFLLEGDFIPCVT